MFKVLLVEDDNNLREIYQARLTAEGYDIVAAQNGEEALVVAKQTKPDLIISDVMMPRISGFEMLDILRNTNELKHTKIIMLTALGQAEDQTRANNLGADRYLVKSQVTLEDIVNAAKALLDEDGGATTPPPVPTAMSAPAPAPAPDEQPPAPTAPVASDPVTPAAPTPVAFTPSGPGVTPQPPAFTPAPAPEPAAVTPTAPIAPAVVAPTPEPISVPSTPSSETTKYPVAPVFPTPAPPAPDVNEPAVEPVVAPSVPELTPPAPPEPITPLIPEAQPATTAAEPSIQPAEKAVTDASAQSLQAEEEALQTQIASYANESAAPTPVSPPETSGAISDDAADDEANDEALAEAVEELNEASVEESAQPPSVVNAERAATEAASHTYMPQTSPVQPTPPPATTNSEPVVEQPVDQDSYEGNAPQSLAGKRTIQPINDLSNRPSLSELLAKEEAKTPSATTPPVINGVPIAPPANQPAATPGQSFDPNIAL